MAEKCASDTPLHAVHNTLLVVARTLLTFSTEKLSSDSTSRDEQAQVSYVRGQAVCRLSPTTKLAGTDQIQSSRARRRCTSDDVAVCRRAAPTWRLQLARWRQTVTSTGRFVVDPQLELPTINLCKKIEVPTFSHYEDMTYDENAVRVIRGRGSWVAKVIGNIAIRYSA